ncbi:hypothetical protein SNARM312S_01883 [Streptomyces narbonensis]
MDDGRRVAQGVVDGLLGGPFGGRQIEYGCPGAAFLDGVGEFAYGGGDRGRQRADEPGAEMGGGGGFEEGDEDVELGEQPDEVGCAAVLAGAAGEDQVV